MLKPFAVFTLLAVIGLTIFAMYRMATGKVDPRESSQPIRAMVVCKDAAEDRLIAPSTADFAGYVGSSNSKTPDGYIATSFVDAQNRFGATLRSRYECSVRCTDEDHCFVVGDVLFEEPSVARPSRVK